MIEAPLKLVTILDVLQKIEGSTVRSEIVATTSACDTQCHCNCNTEDTITTNAPITSSTMNSKDNDDETTLSPNPAFFGKYKSLSIFPACLVKEDTHVSLLHT